MRRAQSVAAARSVAAAAIPPLIWYGMAPHLAETLNPALPQEILEVEQVMDQQAGMELTDDNVEQVGSWGSIAAGWPANGCQPVNWQHRRNSWGRDLLGSAACHDPAVCACWLTGWCAKRTPPALHGPCTPASGMLAAQAVDSPGSSDGLQSGAQRLLRPAAARALVMWCPVHKPCCPCHAGS
jgi:hypothetical protein